MDLRHVAGGVLVAWLVIPASASAIRPDGLDCDQHSEIPAERCSEWKQRNANGRWWCDWDLPTGALRALYGSRSTPISPGLDLTQITRESARSDTATRELLEAYARQHIRQHESLFGFKPNGYELELVDFQRRPPGVKRTVLEDGTVQEEPLAAVSTIHLRQVIRQRALDDATIQLQVDDEDRLLSMSSSFLVDPPQSVPSHSVTTDQGLQVALQGVASGYELTDDDLVSAVETYSVIDGSVRPTIRVFLSIDDPLVDDAALEKQVVVDGQTGAILESFDAFDAHEVPGHTTVPARLFRDNPPGASTNDAADIASALDDVVLQHVRVPPQGEILGLGGYFVSVFDRQQSNWLIAIDDPSGFRILDDVYALQIDYNDDFDPVGFSFPNCKGDGLDPNHPFPNGVDPENLLWERRLDEASAYFNLDQAAQYFLDRHGYRLHRSSRANPQILTAVNHSISAPAWFSSRTQWDGAHPLIAVDKGWCWQIVLSGNDATVGGRVADIYSLADVSRDRDVMMHEFTHAVNWDIIAIGWKQYSSPFKEGIADFFPLSSRYDAATGAAPVFSPWFNDANLDPVVDRATPYYEQTVSKEVHDIGRIWSEFLWDLRDRAFLLETDWAARNVAQHEIEDLQFEALFRMDTKTSSFAEALQNLLTADAETNGKSLSYEIVASAARHGIKLDRGIAAVEPNHYVIGPDIDPALDLTFTIHSGANENCVLEIATDPALFGGESGPTDRYHSESCGSFDVIAGARHPTTNLPIDRENLRTQIRVDPGRVAALGNTGNGEPVLLFYRVTTSGPGGIAVSDIPGAGVSWRHPDLPAVAYVPEGSDPGCVCAFRPTDLTGAPTTALALVGMLAVFMRRNKT